MSEKADPEYEHRVAVMLNADLVERMSELRERVEYLESALSAAHATSAEPQWIVNDIAELGVIVGGRAFFLYKGRPLEYSDCHHDDGTAMSYRPVGKREFGEVCEPLEIMRLRLKDDTLSPHERERLASRYRDGEGWRELSTIGKP